jgi:outer membrane protein TolC
VEEAPGEGILYGTLSFNVPLFARGGGERAEARARSRRAEIELESARRGARVEIESALAAYRARAAAAESLAVALPLLDRNEALARRGYEVGETGLTDLLVVRREIVAIREEALERLLEAALAGLQLEAAVGELR